MSTVASYCRICAAACGILVTVEDGTVTKVRGDPDHPASRGYVCPKGRALPAWHHHPDRLDHPRVDGARATWDEALTDLAGRLGTTVADHGADALGLYLATGMAYDAGGQVTAPTWLALLGSRSFYTAATVDNAPVLVAAELVAGHPLLNPVWDPTVPGLLLLVGTNPVVSHGYGTTLPDPVRYLRDYRALGGQVWVHSTTSTTRHRSAATPPTWARSDRCSRPTPRRRPRTRAGWRSSTSTGWCRRSVSHEGAWRSCAGPARRCPATGCSSSGCAG
jgi:anaerobic selenocysteine-containing dehydrogenase